MTDLGDFARLIAGDHGLCVVSTLRPDNTIQASVVNAGVLDHPLTGRPVVAFVAMGGSRKLANLRIHPQATVVARVGWEWAAAEGPVELVGPDRSRHAPPPVLQHLKLHSVSAGSDRESHRSTQPASGLRMWTFSVDAAGAGNGGVPVRRPGATRVSPVRGACRPAPFRIAGKKATKLPGPTLPDPGLDRVALGFS